MQKSEMGVITSPKFTERAEGYQKQTERAVYLVDLY